MDVTSPPGQAALKPSSSRDPERGIRFRPDRMLRHRAVRRAVHTLPDRFRHPARILPDGVPDGVRTVLRLGW